MNALASVAKSPVIGEPSPRLVVFDPSRSHRIVRVDFVTLT